MPLLETSGNNTADAYAGGVAAIPYYIEDMFSTYLYTGNGATQTITNGIDLSTKGGLVWVKNRTGASHFLTDTNRGAGYNISTNNTNAQSIGDLTAFTSSGFSLQYVNNNMNVNNTAYASWTFRKQPKFFDVVTYTGTGANRTIAHSLGSTPGCIIVKRTDTTGDWQVYHNGLTSAAYSIQLDLTNAQASTPTVWNSTAPTSTVFSVGTNVDVNASGGAYVAYIYAHNAGGFGLTGTDNVISCGSFTSDASDIATINLGYEPQFVMMKASSTTGSWFMADNMRGFTTSGEQYLIANSSGAEGPGTNIRITNTGFYQQGTTGSATTYIYIAIRRGPMKVPTDATKVFAPWATAFNGSVVNDTGFVTDMVITRANRSASPDYQYLTDRLRGANNASGQYVLETDGNYAESASSGRVALTGTQTIQTGFLYQTTLSTPIAWAFKRAPSFFDEVCYTGTGSITTVTHNLGAVPELIIAKSRSGAFNWTVYSATLGNSFPLFLNATSAGTTNYGTTMWGSSTPTTTQFPVGTYTGTNSSGQNYVAYLFATCAGVSKVFSFTGNGTTQTINCGFAGGARFVLLKATSTTGGWYVYDTARGMTTLTDPYLFLNSTAAESATLGSVTTVTTGFAVNESVLAGVNTNGVSYIGLAIA